VLYRTFEKNIRQVISTANVNDGYDDDDDNDDDDVVVVMVMAIVSCRA
jgi:hypothetical protein